MGRLKRFGESFNIVVLMWWNEQMDISRLHIPIGGFFELLCRSANIGCWVLNFQTNQPWWSDTYYELLGIEDKNEIQSFEDFLDNTVHPADRHRVTQSIKNYLHNHVLSDRHEVRLRNRKGHYNWYETFSEARYDEQNRINCLIGGIQNIDKKKQSEEESERLKFFIDVTEEMMGIGTYESDFRLGKRRWSKLMYDIFELPYDADVDLLSIKDFYEEKDALVFTRALEELRIGKKPYDLELRLITAKKNSCWIRTVAKPVLDADNNVVGIRGTFLKIEKQKLKENFLMDIRDKIAGQKFFLDETSAMARVGGWEMDLEAHTIYWSEQTKKIHEVAEKFSPDFDTAVQFYCPSSQKILLSHFNKLVEKGESFDLELEMMTAAANQIWVRAIGKPVYHLGKISKVRGVIQNINEQKRREIELNSALHIINGQNSKLKDFTHIVSHNLRSHAGNLKMITEMVDLETETEVKLEWINLIKNVSSSLSETVNNLNGLVSIKLESKNRLSFLQTYENIKKSLNYRLLDGDVQLSADFSACEWIDYLPAYLESIMLNLITNAIKYKHPERNAIIHLQTSEVNGKPCLKVTDNGLGIDLERHGNRIFKMNQTFHHNSDARGIGLYITKNQVENMGGTIEVHSEVNAGTTFTINF